MTIETVAGAAALITGAYLLGSIPTGALVARARGVNLRAIGSGNIGATNVGRALGKRWAVFVLALDAAKGFLPVFLGQRLLTGAAATNRAPAFAAEVAVAAAGLAAIVGHMFTLFLRGRGGKGVATSLGVSLAISPLGGLCGFLLYGVVYALFRVSSLGSLLGVSSFPLFAIALGGVAPAYLALSAVTTTLVIARHRGNIARLLRGEEKRW